MHSLPWKYQDVHLYKKTFSGHRPTQIHRNKSACLANVHVLAGVVKLFSSWDIFSIEKDPVKLGSTEKIELHDRTRC